LIKQILILTLSSPVTNRLRDTIKAQSMGSIKNDARSETASEHGKFSSSQTSFYLDGSEKSFNMETFTPEKKAELMAGDDFNQIPSQAQMLGKKKIIIIMTALCVSDSRSPIDLLNGEKLIGIPSSWPCFWQLSIW
jgi:hypothetical protein